MKTVSAMELRRHVGALLDEVRLKSEVIILERAGKPVAKLTPVTDEALGPTAVRQRRAEVLRQMAGLGADTPRGRHPAAWVRRERAGSWRT